jgi:phosphoribosylanthranilate isomerase
MKPLFQIKICGITSPKDAFAAWKAGADAIGLNFYDKSSRFVDTTTAKNVVAAVKRTTEPSPRNVSIVGVFVNETLDEIVSKVKSCSLDIVQFHGDELPEIVKRAQSASSRGGETPFIRAVRSLNRDLADIQQEIDDWCAVGVNAVLLDAAAPGEYGGTGRVLDWASVRNLRCDVPWILAGGLNPTNVAEAIRLSGATAVDVASGVEARPGIKSQEQMVGFVAAARQQFRHFDAR